jgi:hypothetical protein
MQKNRRHEAPGLAEMVLSLGGLATFPPSLSGLLVGARGMTMCFFRMLMARVVVALSVLFSGGTMRLRCVLVMFRSLIMSILCHGIPL